MKALNEGEAMQKQAFYRLSCFSEDVKVGVLIFFEDLLFEGGFLGLDSLEWGIEKVYYCI